MRRKIICTILYFLIGNAPLAFGEANNESNQEEEAMEELLSLSLEELLDIKVTATTKSELKIQRAPGVIRVFTAKDIESYHLTTLQELLQQIPGMQINEYRAGHQMIWSRGVQGRYNNKTLLLIDGVPVRDSYYGHFSIDEALPLNQVEKIEIINGPGSVLYGTNAFAAVIKITTKRQGRSARLGLGNLQTGYGAVESDYQNVYGYLDYWQTDGFSPALNSDGEEWRHDQSSERGYALFKYDDGNFQALGSYTDYHYPERYKTVKSDYHVLRQPKYLALRYAADLPENRGSFNVQGYAEHYSLRKERSKYKSPGELKSYDEEYLDTYLLGLDMDYRRQFGAHTLTAGLAYQQDRGDDIKQRVLKPEPKEYEPNLLEGNIVRNILGVFAQEIWAINKNTSLTAGLRYEMLEDFKNEWSYRFGLTTQTEDGLYGKLLYGTAFRIPSYREYLDVLSYNDNLKTEHLNTFELQGGYVFTRGDINLSLFHNVYHDFIGEINVDTITTPDEIREIDGDEMAFNFDKKTIFGLEGYGVFYPTEKLNMRLGAAYLLSAKETLGELGEGVKTTYAINTEETGIAGLSRFTLSVATTYQFNDFYQAGARVY